MLQKLELSKQHTGELLNSMREPFSLPSFCYLIWLKLFLYLRQQTLQCSDRKKEWQRGKIRNFCNYTYTYTQKKRNRRKQEPRGAAIYVDMEEASQTPQKENHVQKRRAAGQLHSWKTVKQEEKGKKKRAGDGKSWGGTSRESDVALVLSMNGIEPQTAQHEPL